MITLLHSYYPPGAFLKELNVNGLYWSHTGQKEVNSQDDFLCEQKYYINNIGKDIGGKLFLMKVLLEKRKQDRYVLFLHDKKSPQVIDGEKWRNELWSIQSQEKLEKALRIMDENENVGIIANSSSIVNPEVSGEEYAYATNKDIIFEQATEFNILPRDKSFVGGTMFVARLQPYLDFFKINDPLEIRASLEAGNILDLDKGTLTHSWERLWSWIITSKGYSIEGI